MSDGPQNKILPIWENTKVHFENKGLPSGFRMLIIGPTGSGKTTLLLRMLLYNLDFDDIVFCSPSLTYQEEYQIFIKALEKGLTKKHIEHIFRVIDKLDNIEDIFLLIDKIASKLDFESKKNHQVKVYKDPAKLPEPEKLVKKLGKIAPLLGQGPQKEDMKKRKVLCIIDDCMTKNQDALANYFTYGRPLGINTVYLTQAYFELPKNTIRGNSQIFIVLDMSETDLRNSFEQLGSRDFATAKEYKEYARRAWSAVKDGSGRNRGYFVVDLTKERGSSFSMNCF